MIAKSPDAGWSGTIVVREYRLGRWERGRGLWTWERGGSGEVRVVRNRLT